MMMTTMVMMRMMTMMTMMTIMMTMMMMKITSSHAPHASHPTSKHHVEDVHRGTETSCELPSVMIMTIIMILCNVDGQRHHYDHT